MLRAFLVLSFSIVRFVKIVIVLIYLIAYNKNIQNIKTINSPLLQEEMT